MGSLVSNLGLHLSCWVQRVIGIHEGAEVSQARGEVGERIETEPGQEKTGADEGLQEQAQIVESVSPASIVRPGWMLQGSGRRRRLCWDGGHLGQGRGLQAHEEIGTHHQLPPALDTGSIGEAEIGPSQLILRLFESVFYPSSQAEGVADRVLI